MKIQLSRVSDRYWQVRNFQGHVIGVAARTDSDNRYYLFLHGQGPEVFANADAMVAYVHRQV